MCRYSAAASGDRAACEKAKICEFTHDEGAAPGAGACGVGAIWAADQLKQCLATAQNADPVVKELATTAERCLDRSSSKEQCGEMAGKCTWTAADDASAGPCHSLPGVRAVTKFYRMNTIYRTCNVCVNF